MIFQNLDGTTKNVFSVGTGNTRVDVRTNAGIIEVRDYSGAWFPLNNNGWFPVMGFSTTAPSTSTITMTVNQTANIKVGDAIRVTSNSIIQYAQVSAITPTLLTIRGVALNTGAGLITTLDYSSDKVVQAKFDVAGTYGNGVTTTLLKTDMKIQRSWGEGNAYCVGFKGTHQTVDSGVEAKINLLVGGSRVSTNNSNLGIQLTTAGTWVSNPNIAINSTNYSIINGDALELEVTAAGGTGNASDLTIEAIFIRR